MTDGPAEGTAGKNSAGQKGGDKKGDRGRGLGAGTRGWGPMRGGFFHGGEAVFPWRESTSFRDVPKWGYPETPLQDPT